MEKEERQNFEVIKEKLSSDIFLEKFSIVVLLILFLLLILLVYYLAPFSFKKEVVCVDGTAEGQCSYQFPYYCVGERLVSNAPYCGCPEKMIPLGEMCANEDYYGAENLRYKYILRGKEDFLNFVVYRSVVDYVSNISRYVSANQSVGSTRRDFKISRISEPIQRQAIIPLVKEIKNSEADSVDQVRIATSLVQNIPYGEDTNVFTFKLGTVETNFNFSRYPYEVLYDNEGVCEGKSELLALILKELGYGVALFYYPEEKHEAVGIKCPVQYSLKNTGYCFIETTAPSIISDKENYYVGFGKLSSNPEIIVINVGKSLPENIYEYKDVEDKDRIYNEILDSGYLTRSDSSRWNSIKEKYGLDI